MSQFFLFLLTFFSRSVKLFVITNYLIIKSNHMNFMNTFLEILAQGFDFIGAVISIPGAIVLDIGSYLHNLAYSIQNRMGGDEDE